MKVKLISYSKPTEEIADSGIDDAQESVSYTHLTLPTILLV